MEAISLFNYAPVTLFIKRAAATTRYSQETPFEWHSLKLRPRTPGPAILRSRIWDSKFQDPELMCLQKLLTFVFRLLNVKKIFSHEVCFSMYSVFFAIFRKHLLLLNFKIKSKVNVITQIIPSHISYSQRLLDFFLKLRFSF